MINDEFLNGQLKQAGSWPCDKLVYMSLHAQQVKPADLKQLLLCLYQLFKHSPCDILSSNRNSKTVCGISECLIKRCYFVLFVECGYLTVAFLAPLWSLVSPPPYSGKMDYFLLSGPSRPHGAFAACHIGDTFP